MAIESRHRLIGAFVLALAIPAVAEAARLPQEAGTPLRPADVVDLRVATEVATSPDGSSVAFVVEEAVAADDGERRILESLWVVPTDGSGEPRRLTDPVQDARSPRWSPDGSAIAYLGRAGDDGAQIFLVPSEGGEPRRLSAAAGSPRSFAWSPGGDEIAYVAPAASPEAEGDTVSDGGAPEAPVARVYSPSDTPAPDRASAIWRLDLSDGSAIRVTDAGLDVDEFAWSPDGDRFAALARASGDEERQVMVIARDGAEARSVAAPAGGFGTRRRILDWSPDGRRIAFARPAPEGRVGHWIGIVRVEGGPPTELLADYEGTVMEAVWADDEALLIQTFEHLSSLIRRLDVETGEGTTLAEAYTSYPGFSMAADARTIAYLGETSEAPMEVWVVREEDAEPTRLTRLNPGLADRRLGDARAVEWTSTRDGRTIEGVLLTPPGYTKDRVWPTVVQVHGGPHFHWGLGWLADWHDWGQLLASNGYVVLLPNPRGSTGRGRAFAEGIERDLGGIAVQDVLDGVDALVERGIADPERLGVGGWSWGGFLTAATVTQTDRFAGAVMGAGISNHFSHAGSPGIGRTDLEFRFGGDPYAHTAFYAERSPVSHAARVTTPTMIVHGERDGKISVNQAWEFYNALSAAGVTTELVIYPGAGHGLSKRAQQEDYLRRVLCWFDRHVRDTAEACEE